MKILVVGSEGQLAQSLRATNRGGIEIVALGRPAIDLTAPDTIDRAIAEAEPGLVVNAAAYTAVDKAESEPDLAHAINAAGPGHLARFCNNARIPLIHLSTDYVYDGMKAAPYVETDPVAPLSAYGRTKLEGERRIADATPHHVIVRTAWVHSPFGANFVKTMLRLALSHDELGVVDDQQGSPTYAPHLADAILDIATRISVAPPGTPGRDLLWGVFHAAGSGTTTWCGLAREIFSRSSEHGGTRPHVRPITTADYPTPATRPANSRLDCSKLERTFAITLPDWHQGVRECVSQLQS